MKSAHHLWSAEKEDGKIRVRRDRMEPEEFEKKASSRKIAQETALAAWGLFGAALVDDPTTSSPIPRSVAAQMSRVAATVDMPVIPSWDELRGKYGSLLVDEARKAVADGMKTRRASTLWNVPFIAASDLLRSLPNVSQGHVRAMCDLIRSGKEREALLQYGEDAKKVATILRGNTKMAVDEAAKKYYESYYGPFGTELVRDIKKRVRADVASHWLSKSAVDEAAKKMLEAYYGEYGRKWVSIVPKLIRPAK